MAYIVERDTTTWTNRRILMGREEITRKLAFGGAWQRIRIGVRGTILPSVVGQYTAGITIGVFSSSNIGGGLFADRSEGYIGMTTGTAYPNLVMNVSNTGSNLYCAFTGTDVVRNANNVQTVTLVSSTGLFFSGNTGFRSAFIVEILKSTASTWTMTSWLPSSSVNALTDKTYFQFYQDVAQTNVATPIATYTANQTTSYANPGAPFINKTLDSVSVAWLSSEVLFMLSDVIVIRIA